MKALTFIEVVTPALYIEDASQCFKVDLWQFYSQPFEIGMLVNPCKQPDGEYPLLEGKEVALKTIKEKYPKILKWGEAENKLLFKGDYLKQVKELFQVKPPFKGTLNEFLTLCKILNEHLRVNELPNKKITLHWKQQIVDKYFKTKT